MKSKIKAIIISGVLALSTFFISSYSVALKNPSESEYHLETGESNLMLVNKNNSLKSSYKPKELVNPNIHFDASATNEERFMTPDSAKAIEKLFKDARKDGINFLGMSAYRSYDLQKDTYYNRIKSVGKKEADKYVAKPGKSEHQTGLAIDVTNEDRWFVKSTDEAQWLATNAHKYGFVLRYPEGKQQITGVAYEPWHIRYVGEKVAKKIYDEQITLEEFLEKK